MIDHVNLPVSDIVRSTKFYKAVLSTLNMQLLMQENDVVGFGSESWKFGVVQESRELVQLHIAFVADNHEQVQSFYACAMEAGGLDNGAPGFRAEYGPLYYSAYVFDPDGHNIEAVCR